MASTDPKTATRGQWEDLVSRIKAKSDVQIAMTDIDPGEGSPLAEDHYIGVYGDAAEIPIIGDILSTPSDVAYVDTANIVDGAVTEEKLGLSYSVSEQATGETWIDGKTIYKKTVDCGALPNATIKNIPHGINNLYRVIKVEGYAISSGGTNLFLPVVATNDQYNVTISTTNINIVMETQADRSAYNESYLTLYYTKSS